MTCIQLILSFINITLYCIMYFGGNLLNVQLRFSYRYLYVAMIESELAYKPYKAGCLL